jgi:pimeloyl-ACP methyl ester carboxylesterase
MTISDSQRNSFASRHAGALVLSAAAAAATALWVEVQSRRAERENSPMGKFIYIDGIRVHFVMRGEGPPVVLLHGNTVTHADFQASGLLDQLARNHQVIAFDRPGFGHSSRPRSRLWTPSAQAALLHRALSGLGIERPVVVGHSMGTMVALAMALDFPASVSSLVLLGGYFYPTVRVDALLTAPVALPILGDVMRYTVTALSARALLNRVVKRMFAPAEVPPGFYSAVARELMLRPMQLRANAEDAAFMMPQARSLSRRYSELRLPVTLIAGEDDKVVDLRAHSQRLHAELAQSRFFVVPQTGHMAHYTAQRQLLTAIEQPGRSLSADLRSTALPKTPGSPSASPELQHRDEHAIS